MRLERVVVTGACGRIGRHVVDELRGRCRVTTLDVRASPWELPHVPADVLDLPGLREAFAGQDAVLHLGALDAHVDASPEAFVRINALGTWSVLQAASETGVRRVVFASSNAALGLSAEPPAVGPRYLPIDEAHPARPTHPYGLSKLLGEVTGKSFARRGGMAVACVRPLYVMFPELVPAIARRLAAPGAPVPPALHPTDPAFLPALDEPLSVARSYVWPTDLARLFRLVLEHDGTGYDLFYASAADSFEPRPTLAYVRDTWGAVPEVRKPEVYARDPHASLVDCSHAADVLGWRPTTDWVALSGLARRPA
jgi:nucleoside-diphosphate-sugar epimerase